MRIFLWPPAVIYRAVIFIWDLYWKIAPKIKLPCRVISVGNIVAGGSGKTPLVIYLAQCSIGAGLKTAIVARGYKRRGNGLLEINEAGDWRLCGDEPLEVKKRAPKARIYVCDSKYKAAQKAFADGAQIIIVDDGFQHRRLFRDIDIVCVDWRQPFGRGGMLPYGTMREPISALNRAHIAVFTSCPNLDSPAKPPWLEENTRAFVSRQEIDAWVNLKTGKTEDIGQITQKAILAFCGIAKPAKFLCSLDACGIKPRDSVAFSDHHQYSSRDIEAIKARAMQANANCLVTTHKDAVKLEEFDFGDLEVYYSIIKIELDDPEAFFGMLRI